MKDQVTNAGIGCGVIVLNVIVWGGIIISAIAIIAGIFGS